ncbi:MAG: chromate resistance protein ChrB domain-containing protein [Terriglobia bacterium]
MAGVPWLLLIHQIPPKPDYLRVKVLRRLLAVGAVAIKNSVYVLPNGEQTHEDFQWVLREIMASGGDAMICEVKLVDGLSDKQVTKLFLDARNKDYAEITTRAQKVANSIRKRKFGSEQRNELLTQLSRFHRRFSEVEAVDFFKASGRNKSQQLLAKLELSLKSTWAEKATAETSKTGTPPENLRSRMWVTRQGIHVDRMASAWLIRRFIDSEAQFKFVPSSGYSPAPREIRFDMFDAEFTHEGDQCTFEVLRDRHGLSDPALIPIGEIVHDIDLKDSKFGRQEVFGIARLIAGIAMAYKEDEIRLARGQAVFEDLYQYFSRHRDAALRAAG